MSHIWISAEINPGHCLHRINNCYFYHIVPPDMYYVISVFCPKHKQVLSICWCYNFSFRIAYLPSSNSLYWFFSFKKLIKSVLLIVLYSHCLNTSQRIALLMWFSILLLDDEWLHIFNGESSHGLQDMALFVLFWALHS